MLTSCTTGPVPHPIYAQLVELHVLVHGIAAVAVDLRLRLRDALQPIGELRRVLSYLSEAEATSSVAVSMRSVLSLLEDFRATITSRAGSR